MQELERSQARQVVRRMQATKTESGVMEGRSMSAAVHVGEPLLAVATAARATGLPYGTLRRLIREKQVAAVEVAGTVRVRLSAVRAVIKER